MGSQSASAQQGWEKKSGFTWSLSPGSDQGLALQAANGRLFHLAPLQGSQNGALLCLLLFFSLDAHNEEAEGGTIQDKLAMRSGFLWIELTISSLLRRKCRKSAELVPRRCTIWSPPKPPTCGSTRRASSARDAVSWKNVCNAKRHLNLILSSGVSLAKGKEQVRSGAIYCAKCGTGIEGIKGYGTNVNVDSHVYNRAGEK